MRGWFIILLIRGSMALHWSGNRTVQVGDSSYHVGFSPVDNATVPLCIQDKRIVTTAGTLSLHASSDIWNHYKTVTLTAFGITFSHDAADCDRYDLETNHDEFDIVVTARQRCATKHDRWGGNMVVLFLLVGLYFYLTTHQPYGKRGGTHPKWSSWWHLLGIGALMQFQPIKTITLALAYDADNHFLLLVLLEGIVMVTSRSLGAALGTVFVNAYIAYLTSSRMVQRYFKGKNLPMYTWGRSLFFFGWTMHTWYQHVVHDVYDLPSVAMSLISVMGVVVLALARRSRWVILSSFFDHLNSTL